MNRTTVRVAAMVLAAGITLSKIVGIGLLAEHARSAGDPVVVLPRVVVTASGIQEPDHRGDRRTESVIASSTSTPAGQSQAASQVRN